MNEREKIEFTPTVSHFSYQTVNLILNGASSDFSSINKANQKWRKVKGRVNDSLVAYLKNLFFETSCRMFFCSITHEIQYHFEMNYWHFRVFFLFLRSKICLKMQFFTFFLHFGRRNFPIPFLWISYWMKLLDWENNLGKKFY